jgi:hypothetical protein
MEVLSAALILVACVSAGVSCMFIARNRGSINKHSRQRIKDYEADIKYLGEIKKADAADYRQEILRLKGSINKMKQGTTVTDTDMQNSGLGEVIMQLIPKKYQKAASFLVPQVEEAVKKDPAIVERIYEKIKSANTNNKPAQPGTETQGVQTL